MIHLYHDYHIHGGFQLIEWRCLPASNVWSFRIKPVPEEWVAFSPKIIGPWALDGLGDCWVELDGCAYRLTPMHRSKEWAKGHYDDYQSRDDQRYSRLPSNIADDPKIGFRKAKSYGYQT